ncbi:MAG: hypothetical protein GX638_01660 [Crenarchaeota archaeon]|nr:hypothetical protein [Thermoproteota archaeon]
MKKYKNAKICALILVLVVSVILSINVVNAQPSVELKMRKDFGYSDFGNGAQGKWTAIATVSDTAIRVEFYLDDILQLNDTDAPYEWPYDTENFDLGLHTIKAVAYDADDNSNSAQKEQNFVDSSASSNSIILVIAIFVITSIIVIVVFFVKNKRNSKKSNN